jgi:hypothetical protein
MDRVESYFASHASSTTAASTSTTSPRTFKPLQYDSYIDNTLSIASPSPSATPSKRHLPFSALPEPSASQDQRTRRQRKQQEQAIRNEMQQSIARLTLGEEEINSEDEVDAETKTTEEGQGSLF